MMSGLMFAKAVSKLLLPPGVIVAAGAAGLIFIRRRFGPLLLVAALLLLWLLSTVPVRDALVAPLEGWHPPPAAAHIPLEGSVIVLLGGGIYEAAPEYGGRDALAHHSLARTLYAAELARATGLEIYATGGAVFTESTPEGAIMARMLRRLGVESARIHAETEAMNTWGNAARVSRLLADRETPVQRVILVTSAWHMPRAVWSFEQQGLSVLPAPCDSLVQSRGRSPLSYLPDASVLADSAAALHEYLGLLWYRWRYG